MDEAGRKYVCEVCGKDCETARRLGQHRRWCVGAGSSSARPQRPGVGKERRRGRRTKKKEEAAQESRPDSVIFLFNRLAREIDARSGLDGEIVAGMRRIVKAVKDLRKMSLRTRHDLLALRQEFMAQAVTDPLSEVNDGEDV